MDIPRKDGDKHDTRELQKIVTIVHSNNIKTLVFLERIEEINGEKRANIEGHICHGVSTVGLAHILKLVSDELESRLNSEDRLATQN